MVLDLGGLNLALMCHGIVSCCDKICLVSTTVKSGTRERRIATISVFSQRLSGSGHALVPIVRKLIVLVQYVEINCFVVLKVY